MLELTGDDVAQLGDTDLRDLVALLCEAELRAAGLPVSAVTAGGAQDAADGGLDVRVSLPADTSGLDFVLRGVCGFQVKVPNMARAAITKEMRPDGKLRPVISELASEGGAYIIVSLKGSVSHAALADRKGAMRDALDGDPNADQLVVDFYDRTRLATWVRQYPGLVAWVRTRIGRTIKGWQGHASWSAPGERPHSEYINDSRIRLFDSRDQNPEGLSALDGINRMRAAVAAAGSVNRLIGLSGVGKTRLLEALFDDHIGENALEKGLAVYCDLSHEPEPSPRDMARHLSQTGQRAILIVDNCPPETHAALTSICAEQGSKVSLITVEYDVRDDVPEATQVFRLEPASSELIEQLVGARAPHVSDVDRRRIATFSEGNARVALALCNTVRRGETLGTLSDQALFDRLFHQRDHADGFLLRAAQVCSLVYSFDGETLEGEDAELPHLAALAGQTTADLFRGVAQLKARDLVQQRSRWRAVLPHALANKLAKQALGSLHRSTLEACFFDAPARLLVSFTRRVGYLHDCEHAQDLVKHWLSPESLLGNIGKLNELGWRMLANVAPVNQDGVLTAIERSFANGDLLISTAPGLLRGRWIALLRSLAYEQGYFKRAARLLAAFAAADEGERRTDKFDSAFVELFHIYLSGTQARIGARVEVALDLVKSSDRKEQQLGLKALGGLLQAGHFSSGHDFSFGSRPRDYGWHPTFNHEVRGWYATVLTAIRTLVSRVDLLPEIRTLIGSHFRELWMQTGAQTELEALCHAIAAKGHWSEGWIGVRSSMRWDSEGMPQDILERLHALEHLLRPEGLRNSARTYLMANPWGDLDDADDAGGVSGYERSQKRTLELAKEVAQVPDILDELLPLAAGKSTERPWIFGKGLALGTTDHNAVWEKIIKTIAAVPADQRNAQLASGFISGLAETSPESAHSLLDASLEHPVLGPHYPRLQVFMELDTRGIARLHRALDINIAPAWVYLNLSGGRVVDSVPGNDLAKLVMRISSLDRGFTVATQILGMRLFTAERSKDVTFDDALVECGQKLLLKCDYAEIGVREDHHLADIARRCLAGSVAEPVARLVFRGFADALANYRSAAHSCDDLVVAFFEVQPIVAMDELLLNAQSRSRARAFGLFDNQRLRPMSKVDVNVILEWAKVDPATRCVALAEAIQVFDGDGKDEEGPVTGWSDVALALLEIVPDKPAYLTALATRFRPSGWSGSLAAIYEERRKLPQSLFEHPDEAVRQWAKEQDQSLAQDADYQRQRERRGDQSFE